MRNFVHQLVLYTLLLISWDAPTSGSAPTGYKIVYGNAANNKTTVVDVGLVTSKTLDIDYSTGSKFMAVKAYNEFGESAESSTIEIGKPGTPANVKVKIAP